MGVPQRILQLFCDKLQNNLWQSICFQPNMKSFMKADNTAPEDVYEVSIDWRVTQILQSFDVPNIKGMEKICCLWLYVEWNADIQSQDEKHGFLYCFVSMADFGTKILYCDLWHSIIIFQSFTFCELSVNLELWIVNENFLNWSCQHRLTKSNCKMTFLFEFTLC